MKRIMVIVLVWLSISPTIAQVLGYDFLTNMLLTKDWQAVNKSIKEKGWTFDKAANESVSWAYNKSSYDDRAESWCSASLKDNKIEFVSYVTNADIFKKIESGLVKRSYKKLNSKILDGSIVTTYSNTKFIFKLQEKSDNQKSKDNNQYIVEIYKYGGVYDHQNGSKSYDDANGNTIVYSLKNGVADGSFKITNPNGDIVCQGQMKNDVKFGEWKFYKDGKISEVRMYDNNGKGYVCKIYDENEKLKIEGKVKTDESGQEKGIGEWKVYKDGSVVGSRVYSNNNLGAYTEKTKIEYKDIKENKNLVELEKELASYNIYNEPLNSYVEESCIDFDGDWTTDTIKYYRNGILVACDYTFKEEKCRDLYRDNGKLFMTYCSGIDYNDKIFYDKDGMKFAYINDDVAIEYYENAVLSQKSEISDDVIDVKVFDKDGLIIASGKYKITNKSVKEYPSLRRFHNIPSVPYKNINAVKIGTWSYKGGIEEGFNDGTLSSHITKDYKLHFNSDGKITDMNYSNMNLNGNCLVIKYVSYYNALYVFNNSFECSIRDIDKGGQLEYIDIDIDNLNKIIETAKNDNAFVKVSNPQNQVVFTATVKDSKFVGVENRYDYVLQCKMEKNHDTGQETFTFMSNGKPADGLFRCYGTDGLIQEEIEIKNGLRHGETIYYQKGEEVKREKYKKGELK